VKRKEPLKLMPLDDLKRVLAEIVAPVLPQKKPAKRMANRRNDKS
jgi:hypothetical protein